MTVQSYEWPDVPQAPTGCEWDPLTQMLSRKGAKSFTADFQLPRHHPTVQQAVATHERKLKSNKNGRAASSNAKAMHRIGLQL